MTMQDDTATLVIDGRNGRESFSITAYQRGSSGGLVAATADGDQIVASPGTEWWVIGDASL